ncbi:MFS transporter [Geobacter sp. DSM 9736]|uniref:MFS transporter n=1 Tax=Geobacter sp. DSM 9736 TaxID=1277350 RepID=UPI000B503DA3|nr:MFS transporter [Geobacter sp. DSM 9736]SNB47384.1 Predicted arabinose efflux permease, MFS family [Geobacter sp. DSM 9736]
MKSLSRNTRKLYAFSFLQMTLFPMAIITLFWKDQIGLSLTQILLLQSILSIVMVVMEYPTGYVSDRVGYRVTLNIASVMGMAGWGMYSFADSFTGVLIAEILLGISLAFISGSDSALLYETLKAEENEQEYARHQGRMSGYGQFGEAFGAIFAGMLYSWVPLLPFILQVAVWLCALLLTRSMVEPPRHHAPIVNHLSEAIHTARYAFSENAFLRWSILLNTVLGLASFYPVWLIQPYMQNAGVPVAWFGPIWTGANLSVAVFAVVSHRITGGLGDRRILILFLILIMAGYLGLGFTVWIWGFLFYYLLTSVRGMRGPMMLAHSQREIPSGRRASILSLQSLCFRLAFACTGPLLGKLADSTGVNRAFQALLLAFSLTLPPLMFLFLRSVRCKMGEESSTV